MPNADYYDALRLGPASTEIFITKADAPAFSQYGIQVAGITHIKDEYFFARQAPRHHTLIYTVAGCGVAQVAGQKMAALNELDAGNVLALPSGVPFNYQLHNGTQSAPRPCAHWHFLWFIVEPGKYWQSIKQPMLKSVTGGQALKPLLALLGEPIAQEVKVVLVKELAGLIAAALISNALRKPRRQALSLQLAFLFDEVAQQLHYPWSAAILAQRLHCAVPSLHRYCQQEYGQSPMQKIMGMRIARAKVLLQETSWNLDVIAAQVGYSSGLSLSKMFKQKEGVRPGGFRGS